MVGSHEKTLGIIPYGFGPLILSRARETLWYAGESRLLVPIFFRVGWAANLGSAPRHPVQVLLLLALVIRRMRVGRSLGWER